MANNYIDKIKKNGVEYDIHDPRVDSLVPSGGGSDSYSGLPEIRAEDLEYDDNDGFYKLVNEEKILAIKSGSGFKIGYNLYDAIWNGGSIEDTYYDTLMCFTICEDRLTNGYGSRLIIHQCLMYEDSGSSISGIEGIELCMVYTDQLEYDPDGTAPLYFNSHNHFSWPSN